MSSSFGFMSDGTPVLAWTLEREGFRVRLIDYGAAITSIEVPDRHGAMADVVLGYDALDDYRTRRGCLGAVVGRYANRIAYGRFELDGRVHALPLRGGPHCLHGGPEGFDKQVWHGEWVSDAQTSVRFVRLSADGEGGFPGNCHVSVTYTVTPDRALVVDYAAEADAPTPINLSQHVYFNLAGHDAGDVLSQELELYASRFTPVDDVLIPTGERRDVRGTAFDFLAPRAIGARMADAHEPQLRRAGGYDHNYIVDRDAAGPARVATVVDPLSGRMLIVTSTEPGVQFYTGNSLDGSQVGKGGVAYRRHAGFCLETQHFPDSPNRPAFPSTILRPGDRFSSRTTFRFGLAAARA